MTKFHSIELCFKEIDRLRANNATLLEALEHALAWLDANERHDELTVNDFIDGSGFTAGATAASAQVRGESN